MSVSLFRKPLSITSWLRSEAGNLVYHSIYNHIKLVWFSENVQWKNHLVKNFQRYSVSNKYF